MPLGSADAIFGEREATIGNASAVRRLHIPMSLEKDTSSMFTELGMDPNDTGVL